MKSRVAAIGIDAAEWSAVQDLVEEGRLPAIERLLRESVVRPLRADMPYRAEAVWTEFLTSRTPDESRYWTTAELDPETYQVTERGAYSGAPFYARPDIDAIVFDVPHSHVAPEARGAQITAWGAHSPQFPTASLPSDLVADVDRRFGVHRAPRSDSWDGWHNPAYGENLTAALLDGLARKAEICSWLVEARPDWDVFLTVLSETHTAGHQFLHGVLHSHPLHELPIAAAADRHFRAVYSAVDDTVARISALFHDDTTIVLFAVHGMQANGSDTANVWLPELLHRLHFGRPFIDFPPWQPEQGFIQLDPESTPLEYLLRFVSEPRAPMFGARTERARQRASWLLRRRAPDWILEPALAAWRRARGTSAGLRWWEMDVRPPADPHIDLAASSVRRPCNYHVPAWYFGYWPHMPYFVIPSFSDVHLRVNLEGRERDGTVAPADYDRVLDDIERLLGEIRDARTGRAVVNGCYRMRARDPMDRDGPSADLVVTLGEVADAVTHPDVGVVGPCPVFRAGEHSNRGWVAIRPAGGAVPGTLHPGRPRDIGPTIVDLLGRAPSPLATGSSFAAAVTAAMPAHA